MKSIVCYTALRCARTLEALLQTAPGVWISDRVGSWRLAGSGTAETWRA